MNNETRQAQLVDAMKEYFGEDVRRINHFIKVYSFAQKIGSLEKLDEKTYDILCTAAIVHDIGIKPAEEKYGAGNCGGKLQEQLGPKPAEEMLRRLGYDEQTIERVCYLIAHHHTYEGVDGIDLQILLEADFIVNADEDALSSKAASKALNRFFKTSSGKNILEGYIRDNSDRK